MMQTSVQPQTYNIHAYPTHLIDTITLNKGQRLVLRPVLPQDAALVQQFVDTLTPESRSQHLDGAAPSTVPTRIDYQQKMGLLVTCLDDTKETVIAGASYRLSDDDTATFTLAVADDWRRLGLGRQLIDMLARAAKSAGARWLHCEVLANNTAMLALMLRCGFTVSEHPADTGLVQVQRSVTPPSSGGRVVHRSSKFLAALKQALPHWFNQGHTPIGMRPLRTANAQSPLAARNERRQLLGPFI